MNCQTTRERLQELLDENAGAGESALRAHLHSCPACLGRYKLLELTARAVASLPYYDPGPGFSARVLAALPARARLERWTAWLAGALLSIESCWLAALLLMLGSRLGPLRALRGLRLLLHPASALPGLKLRLAEACLSAPGALRLASLLQELAAPLARPDFLAQAACAALLAGALLALAARRPAWARSNRGWRTR